MADPDEMTFAELLVASTAQDAMAYLLTRLAARGLPVTNWQPTGLYRSLVAAIAEFLGDLGARVPLVAKSGFLRFATGGWLTLLAQSAYQTARQPAQFGVIRLRLANGTATPHTITPGQLTATLATPDGRRWFSANVGNETLTANGTLDLDFRAEFAGAAGSAGFVLTPSPGPAMALQTPLPGVAVAVTQATDSDGNGLGTVVVTAGAEIESDAQLVARCMARWGSLAWAGPSLAYVWWAREASASIRRVFVDDTNPDGPGTATVYLAGDTGIVGAADVTAANALVQARKPPTGVVTVAAAALHEVTFAATVSCPAGHRAAARAAIYDALSAYQRELAIGDGTGAGALLWSQVFDRLMAREHGVTNVDKATVLLDGSGADYVPALGTIAALKATQLSTTLPTISFV